MVNITSHCADVLISNADSFMGVKHRQYALEEGLKNAQRTKATMAEKKYCICRSIDDTGFMILCENCNEWFHGRCINISEKQAEAITSYYCTMCLANNPALKIRYKRSAMKSASSGHNEINEENGGEGQFGPAPDILSTTRMYYVENILDKRHWFDGSIRYLVKWADYDSIENSWEPAANLASCQYILDRFERRLKRRERGEATSSESEVDNDKDHDYQNDGADDAPVSGSSDSDSDTSSSDGEEEPPPDNDDGREAGSDKEDAGDGDDAGNIDNGDGDDNGDDKDDQGDSDKNKSTPKREFCLLDKIPENKTPTKMLLTLPLRVGGLAYMIEVKNEDGILEPVFVDADFFREEFPQIVIDFYEKHVQFSSDAESSSDEDGEVQGNVYYLEKQEDNADVDADQSDMEDEEETDVDTAPPTPPACPPQSPPAKRKLSDTSNSEISSESSSDESADDEGLSKKPKH